jgi:hypothetical protein
LTDQAWCGTVSTYDAPVMRRTARLTALTLLTLLALLAIAVAVATLGLVGVVLFVIGASLVIPEIVVMKRKR